MVGFTQEGAKRIAASTVYVERLVKNGPPRRGHKPGQRIEGFLAQLTGQGDSEADPLQKRWKYSWVAVTHNIDSELMQKKDYGKGSHIPPVDPEEKHIGYAVESLHRSEHCCIGDIVWLRPCREYDYYIFDYSPEVKIAKTEEEITEATETNMGKGGVTVYWLEHPVEPSEEKTVSDKYRDIREEPEEGEPALPPIEPSGLTAYNTFASSIDADTVVHIEYTEGIWIITAADCEG